MLAKLTGSGFVSGSGVYHYLNEFQEDEVTDTYMVAWPNVHTFCKELVGIVDTASGVQNYVLPKQHRTRNRLFCVAAEYEGIGESRGEDVDADLTTPREPSFTNAV